MKIGVFLFLLVSSLVPVSAQQATALLGNHSGSLIPVASSYTGAPVSSAPTIAAYGYNATGVAWGQVVSGINATGSAGQTCLLTAFNNSSTATATVYLTGVNTIDPNTPIHITASGSGAIAAPTAASAGNGTATCSGTAVLLTGLGAYVPLAVDASGNLIGGTPYTLPIASTTVLGGVKPDGTSCTVNPTTGVLTCGSGSGTVNAGTTGQIAYYGANGTVVSGTAHSLTNGSHWALGNGAVIDPAPPPIEDGSTGSVIENVSESSTTAAGVNGMTVSTVNAPTAAVASQNTNFGLGVKSTFNNDGQSTADTINLGLSSTADVTSNTTAMLLLEGGSLYADVRGNADVNTATGVTGEADNWGAAHVSGMIGTQAIVANHAAGTVDGIVGNNIALDNYGSGTVSIMVGSYVYGDTNATGTITTYHGYDSNFHATAPTTTDLVAGFYAYSPDTTQSEAGTITNNYGLYIEEQAHTSAPTVTNGYGIYIAGTVNKNVIAGPLQLSGLPTTAQTSVVGIDSSGNLYKQAAPAGVNLPLISTIANAVSSGASGVSTVTTGSFTPLVNDVCVFICKGSTDVKTFATSVSETWNAITPQSTTAPSGTAMFWAKIGTSGARTATCTNTGGAETFSSAAGMCISGTLGTVNTSAGNSSNSNITVTNSGAISPSQRTVDVFCDGAAAVNGPITPSFVAGGFGNIVVTDGGSPQASGGVQMACEIYTTFAGYANSSGQVIWGNTSPQSGSIVAINW